MHTSLSSINAILHCYTSKQGKQYAGIVTCRINNTETLKHRELFNTRKEAKQYAKHALKTLHVSFTNSLKV